MNRLLILAPLALVAGCKSGVVVEERIRTVTVTVRGPCPAPESYTAIKTDRPRPLREQPMPASPEERVGRTSAQLGKYEAEGGWADRAMSALDRCQREGVDPQP